MIVIHVTSTHVLTMCPDTVVWKIRLSQGGQAVCARTRSEKQGEMSRGLDLLARWDFREPRRKKHRPGEVENERTRHPQTKGWPRHLAWWRKSNLSFQRLRSKWSRAGSRPAAGRGRDR